MNKHSLTKGAALLLAIWMVTVGVSAQPVSHDIRPGYGVSDLRWLSDYHAPLANTAGDTPVYIMKGALPGGTLLLLGGTHGNEIAGIMAATLVVERALSSCGTVIVIPHTNNSAAKTNTEYLVDYQGESRSIYPFHASWISLPTSTSERRIFHYGSRFTQPEDQGSNDPASYIHPSGLESMGADARNLDRVHPGLPDGTLTEQISHALIHLADVEKVDVVVDMHESSPASSLAHTLICHPRGIDIASFALFDLEIDRIYMKLELSRPEHAGISHWEFGEALDVFSFLIETPNPGQDWSLALPEMAAQYGAPFASVADTGTEVDVVNDAEHPLSKRVFEQLSVLRAILSNYSLLTLPGNEIELAFPFDLGDLIASDLGAFLR